MRPVLFFLPGDIPVFGYGVMLGLSCVLGIHIAIWLSERSGIERRHAIWLGVALIGIGIAGGRVHELFIQGKLLSGELFALQHSGRTAYGGFIAGTLGGLVLTRWLGVPFWRFGDAVAPTLALGLGLTRIGCFFAGCDYGRESARWGLEFPRGSPAWSDQYEAGRVAFEAPASLPVFPAQLLSSAVGLALFGLTLYWWHRRRRREGAVLLLFAFSYGLARAGLEQLREDAGRGELLGMTTSTTIGLASAAVAVVLALPPLARLRPWAFGGAGDSGGAGASEPGKEQALEAGSGGAAARPAPSDPPADRG